MNFDVTALNRIVSALQGLKASQIDFHYWRKTPVGLPFDKTVACPAGWLCMMRVFDDFRLRLEPVSALSDYGFVPVINANGKELRGYAAMGYIVQATKNTHTAERYGRALFSFPGASELDKKESKMDALINPRGFVLRRIAVAREQSHEIPARVHYLMDSDD